eukprot:CAMPEP_0113404096 /NCGR_PEP_ID=MMETSP0013_2-20120614/18196_1 /TAXON_ID=2843 ORGANISM="Skeletonema costatum, Strain 1716" /NCGR_SAMPLE_ID=MMETSP0013_2 /ASSEMBLY_ACC=CAM_ASM_000158 /LENGTH=312 /DNA_ID=CAMNT_0000289653 /DNA_START=440 /DNA_END=1375 /DNA_ORIENTATION=- /assembly_acc=CAM_ASM_000158
MGGEQVVPGDVTHVIIDRSVNIIPERAFYHRELVSVKMHEGIKIIVRWSFSDCFYLRKISLLGVREVEEGAFYFCRALTNVEFGNNLETIGNSAFRNCGSLQNITMPSVRFIGYAAFAYCEHVRCVEFGCNLETIGSNAFSGCPNLRRIAIPLKDDIIFPLDTHSRLCNQFDSCPNLTKVDLVGIEGIHKTISSLLLESWQTEISAEINRINQVLPNSHDVEKTDLIRQWVRSVFSRMEHYKAEHNRLLKEHMTQLELALWKAKLDEKEEENSIQKVQAEIDGTRKEKRITSGASIVIKNVLPFLRLESPQW